MPCLKIIIKDGVIGLTKSIGSINGINIIKRKPKCCLEYPKIQGVADP